MSIEFTDNTAKIRNEFVKGLRGGMETLAGEIQSQTFKNSRFDTGQTRNSYQYKVVESGNELTASVGSDYENAIWEEYGTGEYALEGNGRKGGWLYEDKNGETHFTYGKTPNRPLFKAVQMVKPKLPKILNDSLGGLK